MAESKEVRYIVSEYRIDKKQTYYVCAKPGYARCENGTMVRDGSFKGGPEWTTKRDFALEFTSHRVAARVANTSPSSVITEIPDWMR